MAEQEFRSEYLGLPPTLTPEEKRLRELAREYHEKTEAYDRKICTGAAVRGTPVPANPEERMRIIRHAMEAYGALKDEAKEMGFTPKECREAVLKAGREGQPNNP